MKFLTYLFLFFILSVQVFATHNRAGEITYKQVPGSPNKYEFMVVTYTFTGSAADRPEIEIYYGDAKMDTVPRINGSGEIIPGTEIKKNLYKAIHTYTGPGIYNVFIEDPNRNADINNIPNSVQVSFYIETAVFINPFLGYNTTPVLLNPPIDNGTVGEIYVHNPGAFDLEGDSLSYKLIICKTSNGLNIPGYSFPDADVSLSINEVTGDFIWDSPKFTGEYNIAILITEWRAGIKMGTILRDMQITILPTDNRPPEIIPIDDLCVTAGDSVIFMVYAFDPDSDQVELTATGGPLLGTPPAVFNNVSGKGSVKSLFSWKTECKDVRIQPYQMFFKAEDKGNDVDLVDMETVFIRVVSPSPKNLTATPIGDNIVLNWNQSPCSNSTGYKIYRKINKYGFIPGPCEVGVPAYTGYVFIAQVDGLGTTTYTDSNQGAGLDPGTEYCYMVISFFEDNAESYASEEVCTELKKDIPLITHADVRTTSTSTGKIYIDWTKPVELDTAQTPPPYEYRVYRSEPALQNSLIFTFTNLNDTIYTDSLLNTTDIQYTYNVELHGSPLGELKKIGSTKKASSLFLKIKPSDNSLILTIDEAVPWKNTEYVIYKQNNAGSFDSIAATNLRTYTDINLVNGRSYCYKVKSTGNYFSEGIEKKLINFSQEACEEPYDDVPPCFPTISAAGNCDEGSNRISWNNPNLSCADDVVSYKLFFKPFLSSPFTVIREFNSANDTSFIHVQENSIAGCYFITSLDSNINESDSSNMVCIENCPEYFVPNVFTPNGDGVNDRFIPFPFKYVKDIDLKIYNRWGQLLFETTDPKIQWDGKNQATSKLCEDGTYYYILKVNEIKLKGIVPRNIHGFFLILGTNQQRQN